MRWTIRLLMLGLVSLSLSNCATNPFAPPITDSFCQVYNKVVIAKGDGAIMAKTEVKKRILANELTYKDQCPGK